MPIIMTSKALIKKLRFIKPRLLWYQHFADQLYLGDKSYVVGGDGEDAVWRVGDRGKIPTIVIGQTDAVFSCFRLDFLVRSAPKV